MVLLRRLNNADAGTGTKLGSVDTDKLADYYNDIDVSETPRINTPTEYRSGILKVRDGSNAFNVVMKSATQTANRDFTIPALTANDSPAMLAVANTFTALQSVSVDTDTMLALYRPVSTTNTLAGLGFYERNSSNASVLYSGIYNKLITNTAGDEDGKLTFWVRKDGVLTEVMSVDKNGLLTAASFSGGAGGGAGLTANTFTGVQTISAGSALPLLLYRAANTATNKIGIDFQHNNASSVQKTFGNVSTQLVTNTAGSEDGKLHFSVMKAGTLTEVMTIDKNGLVTAASFSGGGGGGGTGITVLLNSGAITTTASNSSEFNMLNYTLPANTLGTNGCLRVRVSGYLVQNNSTSQTYQFTIYFGGGIVFQGSTQSMAQQAANRPFILEFVLGNSNSTSAQSGTGSLRVSLADVAANTGDGDINDDETQVNSHFGFASTVSTTSSAVLTVTMQMSTSSSSTSTSVRRQTVEFLPGA